jgi:hypothetical protein
MSASHTLNPGPGGWEAPRRSSRRPARDSAYASKSTSPSRSLGYGPKKRPGCPHDEPSGSDWFSEGATGKVVLRSYPELRQRGLRGWSATAWAGARSPPCPTSWVRVKAAYAEGVAAFSFRRCNRAGKNGARARQKTVGRRPGREMTSLDHFREVAALRRFEGAGAPPILPWRVRSRQASPSGRLRRHAPAPTQARNNE